MFPVIFLLLFASLFGDQEIEGLGIDAATYYVPGIITLAVVSATLVNVAMRMVEMRESGRLKRLHGHAAADLGLLRRPDRELVRRLAS